MLTKPTQKHPIHHISFSIKRIIHSPIYYEPNSYRQAIFFSPPTEYGDILSRRAHTNKAQVPHPLFPTFELRVQTDGEISPKEAVIAACKDLVTELASFDREFKREYELRKMVGQEGL